MKALFLFIISSGISLGASAALFDCGIPQNSQGQKSATGISYSVEFNQNGWVYLLSSKAGKQTRTELKETSSWTNRSSFAAENVEVNIVNHKMTLSENGDYSAKCALLPDVGQDQSIIDATCANRFLADPFFTCEDIQP